MVELLVIISCNSPESLLACSVPYLQFAFLVVQSHMFCFLLSINTYEIHSNCVIKRFSKPVLYESHQDT